MKTKLFILLLITTLFACNKDDDNNGESLPAATQVGANTVGCLVNGEVFLPHAEGLSPSVNCFYQFVDEAYYFTMAFSDLRGNSIETVNVFNARIELQEDGVYNLNQGYNPEMGGGAEYFLDLNNKFSTNLNYAGELKITRIDRSNSIVSGTFWFNAINESGEIVEIRDGRFDWNY